MDGNSRRAAQAAGSFFYFGNLTTAQVEIPLSSAYNVNRIFLTAIR
jgi:hypothetical protein